MEVYNFYSKEYGIGIELRLIGERTELRYKCTSIKSEYRGEFDYQCKKNKWCISSNQDPDIHFYGKILFLRGYYKIRDNNVIILSENRLCVEDGNESVGVHFAIMALSCKEVKQTYNELVEALNELGNDYNEAEMFLDM